MRQDLSANIKVQISKEHKILLIRYERISKDLVDKLIVENSVVQIDNFSEDEDQEEKFKSGESFGMKSETYESPILHDKGRLSVQPELVI